MANELQPVFKVQVDLDGLDDAKIQTDNARAELEAKLDEMQADGTIRGYEVTDASD